MVTAPWARFDGAPRVVDVAHLGVAIATGAGVVRPPFLSNRYWMPFLAVSERDGPGTDTAGRSVRVLPAAETLGHHAPPLRD